MRAGIGSFGVGGIARLLKTSAARLAGLALLILLLVLRLLDPVVVSNIRNQTFDLYQRATPRAYTPQPVAIVDIDEASLRRFGQWPWPRTRLAELVDKLTAQGAIVIGFDMVFAEPDRLSPLRIAEDNPGLPEDIRTGLAKLRSNEAIFAQSIKASRVVVGETASRAGIEESASQPAIPEVPNAFIGPDPSAFLPQYKMLVQNMPELSQASAGRGVFTVEPEADGVFRRIPLAIMVNGKVRLALSTELLRIATGGNTSVIRSDEYGVSMVQAGGVKIPTDRDGKIWPWFSKSDKRRYVSASDLLAGTMPVGTVAGKMVLVGTSAVGLEDYRTTPVEAATPGVEIHAQIIENIVTSQFLKRPSWATPVEFFSMLLVGIAIVLAVPRLGAIWAALAAFAMVGGFAAGTWYVFAQHRLLIDASFPVVSGLGLFIVMATANYIREEAQKRTIRGAFGQYLSPALVDHLTAHPESLSLGGETRELSVLFTDVRGFTGIAESYRQNPQGLTRLMNRFLTVMSNAILAQDGTIDKYMGDAIMAFWNAPLDEPEHAMRSCKAALAMIENVHALNDARRTELKEGSQEVYTEIKVGIGINSGECVVGNMGSDMRFDYTALGDTVNTASRLEGQSKPYGFSIILGYATASAVIQTLAVIEIDQLRVKGKAEPERIHALLGNNAMRQSDAFLALKALNATMLSAYRTQNWDGAFAALEEMPLLGDALDLALSDYLFIYETRIAEYRINPPGRHWDAVYVATEK